MRDLQSLIKQDILDNGGWCFDEKRDFIHKLITDNNCLKCVEIGVYKGSSLLSFAEALEDIGGHIVGIDPWSFEMSKNDIPTASKEWESWIYNEVLKGQETFDKIYEDLLSIIKINSLSDTVELIRKPSQDVFINFEIESIDILHIDGNHNEMNVSRDILLYLPLVKKNGYIIMDDINWDGVKKSVNNFLIKHVELVVDFGGWSCYLKK